MSYQRTNGTLDFFLIQTVSQIVNLHHLYKDKKIVATEPAMESHLTHLTVESNRRFRLAQSAVLTIEYFRSFSCFIIIVQEGKICQNIKISHVANSSVLSIRPLT